LNIWRGDIPAGLVNDSMVMSGSRRPHWKNCRGMQNVWPILTFSNLEGGLAN